MDIDIQTLNESFRRLVPKSDRLAQRFYETLFERYPRTLELFAGVRFDEQKQKLLRALALVVRNIERPDFLQAYLRGLGAIHVAYGVSSDLYPAVCECLLSALAETAGKQWSREEDVAWRGAFRLISDTMIEGAARVA